MEAPERSVPLGIGIADADVHACDHIAYFWETEKEFRSAVGFLEIGLRTQDHCVIFGYEDANERVLAVLRERGFDQQQLQADGRLSVLTAHETAEGTLQRIGETFAQAVKNGAPLVRLLGNIGWHRPKWPEEMDLLVFEAKVTDACRLFPCVVVCMYDVRRLSGTVLLRGGLETHPVTIRGNVTRVNPYYVDVDTYLKREQEASAPRLHLDGTM